MADTLVNVKADTIEDFLKNAQAATALGWHGVHHTNAAQTEAKLRELGLPV